MACPTTITRQSEHVAVQDLPKNATFTDVGRRGHNTVTVVTIPSVPSAPINKCFRWYPVLSLRIPLRQSTICPLAKTYNADSTILAFFSPVKINIQKLLQCIMQTFTKITNSSKQILIKHRASTSMYSLTFCTRIMLPERHQRKPAVQAAAVMFRTPPSTASHRRASHAHFPYTAGNFENDPRHPPVTGQQRAQTPLSVRTMSSYRWMDASL